LGFSMSRFAPGFRAACDLRTRPTLFELFLKQFQQTPLLQVKVEFLSNSVPRPRIGSARRCRLKAPRGG
jgi:hypothetical protein